MKIQLAPMLGLVEAPFCNALQQLGGFDQMMAPYMLADSQSPIKLPQLARRFANYNSNINLVPQLLSNDANGFIHFAHLLSDLGYTEVNLNMGCPQPFVTQRGRGAALLLNLAETEKMLEQITAKITINLSVKIRLGFNCNTLSNTLRMLNQLPLSEVIIHARTAEQMYNGIADIQAVASEANTSVHPIIFNGDICSVQQCEKVKELIPNLAGVMIGRGAISNPFVALQITKGQAGSTKQLQQFCETVRNNYAEACPNPLNRLKELWKYFALNFENQQEVFDHIKRTTTLAELDTTIKNIFEQQPIICVK